MLHLKDLGEKAAYFLTSHLNQSNCLCQVTLDSVESICSKPVPKQILNSCSSVTDFSFLLKSLQGYNFSHSAIFTADQTFLSKNIKPTEQQQSPYSSHGNLLMAFLTQIYQSLHTLLGLDDCDAKEKPSKILPMYLTSLSDPTKSPRNWSMFKIRLANDTASRYCPFCSLCYEAYLHFFLYCLSFSYRFCIMQLQTHPAGIAVR